MDDIRQSALDRKSDLIDELTQLSIDLDNPFFGIVEKAIVRRQIREAQAALDRTEETLALLDRSTK